MMLKRRTDSKTGTRTGSKPAQLKCACTFHKIHAAQEFASKMPWASWSPRLQPTPCASLRNSKALGDFIRANWHGNFKEKCRGPNTGPRPCASLCSPSTLGHFTRVTLDGNLEVK